MYRFPLGLAVVAVHSGEYVTSLAGTASSGGASGSLGLWVVQFLTMICRLATPAFLVIAGFVFFRDGPVSLEAYRRKVKARLSTLLVPYLAWNFITILFLCAPAAYRHFFLAPGSYNFTPMTFIELAKWIAGWPVYPADAPLWFVRDLLLLILIVPLWNLFPKRAQAAGLGVLFVYWLAGPTDFIPGGIPRAASVFFFLAGAWLGTNRISLRAGPMVNRITVVAATAFLLSAAASATCGTTRGDFVEVQLVLDRIVRMSGALLVVCAGTRTSFPAWLSGPLLRLSPAAFFLFAFHYCVFSWITSLWANFPQGRPGAGHEVAMFALVFSTVIAVSLAFYFLLKRHAPSLLGLLDGNRSERGPEPRQVEHEVEATPLPIVSRRVPSFE